MGIFGAKELGCSEAVHQDGLSARALVLQQMEKLQSGRVGEVCRVSADSKCRRRMPGVFLRRIRSEIPEPAIVRDSDKSNALYQCFRSLWAYWNTVDIAESIFILIRIRLGENFRWISDGTPTIFEAHSATPAPGCITAPYSTSGVSFSISEPHR